MLHRGLLSDDGLRPFIEQHIDTAIVPERTFGSEELMQTMSFIVPTPAQSMPPLCEQLRLYCNSSRATRFQEPLLDGAGYTIGFLALEPDQWQHVRDVSTRLGEAVYNYMNVLHHSRLRHKIMSRDAAAEHINPRQDVATERANARQDAATEHIDARREAATGSRSPCRYARENESFFRQRQAHCRALALRLRRQHKPYTLGRDDSLLGDSDMVYVVDHQSFGFPSPLQRVDYFHGIIGGRVTAQMYYQEINVAADAMIGMRGCFTRAVGCIQQAFRARRSTPAAPKAQPAPKVLATLPLDPPPADPFQHSSEDSEDERRRVAIGFVNIDWGGYHDEFED